jgi:hypothetical protein
MARERKKRVAHLRNDQVGRRGRRGRQRAQAVHDARQLAQRLVNLSQAHEARVAGRAAVLDVERRAAARGGRGRLAALQALLHVRLERRRLALESAPVLRNHHRGMIEAIKG